MKRGKFSKSAVLGFRWFFTTMFEEQPTTLSEVMRKSARLFAWTCMVLLGILLYLDWTLAVRAETWLSLAKSLYDGLTVGLEKLLPVVAIAAALGLPLIAVRLIIVRMRRRK